MKRTALMLIACLISLAAIAQNTKAPVPGSYIYKGTMNGSMPVTLFLDIQVNECSDQVIARSMYQYEGKSIWLLTDVQTDDKGNWCLTETAFTGVLILHQQGTGLQGKWLSPKGDKTFPVKLQLQPATEAEKEQMRKKLEERNYEEYDC